MFKDKKALRTIAIVLGVAVWTAAVIWVVNPRFIEGFMEGNRFMAEQREFFEKFPRRELSQQEAVQTVDNLQRFSINGQESNNDWITVIGNRFEATGAFLPFSDTVHVGEELFSLSVLVVPETVLGVTVFHLLPLVVTPETEGGVFGQSELSLYAVEFSVQDKWLHAEVIKEFDGEEISEDKAWESLSDIELYFKGIFFGGEPYFQAQSLWLSINDGERFFYDHTDFIYDGIESVGLISSDEYLGIYNMLVIGNFGLAPIFHVLQVYYTEEPDIDDIAFRGALITLRDGKFVFAE